MKRTQFNRRHAVTGFASWLGASPLLGGQQLVGEPAGRIAPVGELVNTFEFAAMAERQLGSVTFALIAGNDRRAFDRMTLRPRMMVKTEDFSLTTELFGEKLFTPILVGPVSGQARFHPDGELATVQGASAAKAIMVVSSRSSRPLREIAAQSKTTLWYQVFPEPDSNTVRTRIKEAVDLGCKAICITVGTPYQPVDPGKVLNPSELPVMGNPGLDWNAIDQLRQGVSVPVLLKGIMRPEEARTAVQRGIAGIVVSDYGGLLVSGLAAPIEVLPSIADAVGGKAPILVDGGFRRGTDVLKALALGARAVLLARPPMWGLGAYGADGVATLLKLLYAELGRDMAMCGKVAVADLDRNLVTIHRRG